MAPCTIVNLISHTVEKTLAVTGHPRTVVSTSNSLYGKVYVASPDSTFLTIIRTDQDIVDTTVLIEGNIVDVRVTSQNGTRGNANTSSRIPGGGQPCYLPGTEGSLATCQVHALNRCFQIHRGHPTDRMALCFAHFLARRVAFVIRNTDPRCSCGRTWRWMSARRAFEASRADSGSRETMRKAGPGF